MVNKNKIEARKRCILLMGLLIFTCLFIAYTKTGAEIREDLVIKNAKVITVDRDFSLKQAIAVKGDEIIAVGTNEEIRKHVGEKTRVLDLKGKAILPGINDGHIHLTSWASDKPPQTILLRPPAVKAISDIRTALAEKVKEVKPGEWIIGKGWNPAFLEECQKDSKRYPSKKDLDDIAPNNPVVLRDFSGHEIWVNSKALELAGIRTSTPDPVAGQIVRDPATREPTGILREQSAMGLVLKRVPLFNKEQIRKIILEGIRELNANGITSYTEILGPGANEYAGGVLSAGVIDVYKDLYKEGLLTARVNILLLLGKYGGVGLNDLKMGIQSYSPPEGMDPKWVRFPGLKIFADGIPPLKTAWMWQEYVSGGYGLLTIPGSNDEEKYYELKEMIALGHSKGFQMGVHAVGDRAISATLDGFEEAIKDKPWIHARHYVIHGDFISFKDAARAAKYDIGVNMQPVIQSLIADDEPAFVGPERAAYEFPSRTVLDAGVRLTFSSDAAVTYPNWRNGVQAAILRESVKSGTVSGPEQRIKREEAIHAYTINGAWQDQLEFVKGSIEVGKLADFCILGDDILTVDAHKIKDVPVLMTIVAGKIVYDASGNAFK
jgi:predicted amidohydrolase YtcJ